MANKFDDKMLFERMNLLRGIMAFVVIFSHIWAKTNYILLLPFNKLVTIAVSYFLFLSGYGLLRSSEIKKDYSKEIILKNIPLLLYMSIVAYVISSAMECIFCPFNNLYTPFSIVTYLRSTNWYVYELLIFYLLFSIYNKFAKEKILNLVFISTIILFVFFFYSKSWEAYYNSIFGFVCGMAVYKYKEWIIKNQKIIVFIFSILFVSTVFSTMYFDHNSIIFAIIRNISAFSVEIIVFIVVGFIELDNKILKHLSKISGELFFYNTAFYEIFDKIIETRFLLLLTILVSTIVISELINPTKVIFKKKLINFYERGKYNET